MTPKCRKIASAVGAKTARACDNCVQKRARWYCEADDAFLCQACDTSVHSANPLARRHKRVRLKTASLNPPPIHHKVSTAASSSPSWHPGFITRKARTPRRGKQRHRPATAESDDTAPYLFPPQVPDLGTDDSSSDYDENDQEEQLLYRVPIYDPFVAEFCTSTPSNEACVPTHAAGKLDQTHDEVIRERCGDINCFVPSETDLAEFSADVETLLGKGLDQETYTLEELGLLDDDYLEENRATISADDYSMSDAYGGRRVTKEGEDSKEAIKAACRAETENNVIIREPFRLNFNYDAPRACEEEEDVKAAVGQEYSRSCREKDISGHEKKGKAISLRLDYEAIRAAWAGQGPPWMDGERPDVMNPDQCWNLGSVAYGTEVNIRPVPYYGDTGIVGGVQDGGRDARVLRYREKRRTRLFSKKIRYEVRKLNAEKRPRMKGRFVKRSSSFTPTGFPNLGK